MVRSTGNLSSPYKSSNYFFVKGTIIKYAIIHTLNVGLCCLVYNTTHIVSMQWAFPHKCKWTHSFSNIQSNNVTEHQLTDSV